VIEPADWDGKLLGHLKSGKTLPEQCFHLLKLLLFVDLLSSTFVFPIAVSHLLPLVRCWQIRRGEWGVGMTKLFVTAPDLRLDGLDEIFHQVEPI
jgi:hypothetical protein